MMSYQVKALNRGGKVLIPVFALGRAQELCLVVESYWERMGLQSIPVFFNAGLTERANAIYRIFPEWMQSEGMGNPFDFKFIRPFDMQFAELEGPMLLFASPGSLQSGMQTVLLTIQEPPMRYLKNGLQMNGIWCCFPAMHSQAQLRPNCFLGLNW